MSYIDDLLAAYARFVALPWQENLAPPQRVWMAVYPPEDERRLRRHLPAFRTATIQAKHTWHEIDITTAFEIGWPPTNTATLTSKTQSCLRRPSARSSIPLSSTFGSNSVPMVPPAVSSASSVRERCSGWGR